MAKSAAARKQGAYRARLREQGLKVVQLWVPDFDDPAFQERLRRSVELLKDHPSTREADEIRDALMGEMFEELDRSEGGGQA